MLDFFLLGKTGASPLVLIWDTDLSSNIGLILGWNAYLSSTELCRWSWRTRKENDNDVDKKKSEDNLELIFFEWKIKYLELSR